MAKIVRVTWTDPNPTTNVDHLEVWRSINSGAAVQVGGDLTLGVETLDDDNGGPGFADNDSLDYSVRAYNSTGQYSELTGNIVISGSTQYGILTDAAADAHFVCTSDPGTADFAVGLTVEDFVAVSGGHLVGIYGRDHTETDGLRINAATSVNLVGNGTASLDIKWHDGVGGQTSVNQVSIAPGDFVELRRAGDEVSIWVNGVKSSVTANLAVGEDYGTRSFSVGATKITQRNTTVKFSSFVMKGDSILPTSQNTGATIAGSTYTGTLIPESLVGGADAMYYAIP